MPCDFTAPTDCLHLFKNHGRVCLAACKTVLLSTISVTCLLNAMCRFGANDAAARASAATERMKEGMAGSLAAMKRLNLGFKRSSQQESG